MHRLRERVVPALEALLQAVHDRVAFGRALQASRDELRWIAQEQAALRRVATLVARGVSTTEMFNGIAGEMGLILQAPCTMIGHYEPDGTLVVVGSWSGDGPGNALPLGSRWPLEGESIPVIVLETGRAAHITNYADATWKMAGWAREREYFAAIGTPILVDGGLWGVLKAFYHADEDVSDYVDEHMLELTELVTIAISNAPAASARRRLRILSEAAMGIGQTLDMVRTAEELAEATVSRFADLVTVDLAESVLRGQEAGAPSAGLRRVAMQDIGDNSGITGPLRQEVHYPSLSAQARCLAESKPVLSPEPEAGIRSLIAVPLCAHGRVLGVVTFMRRTTPFADDDLSLAEQLSTRAAVCLDNARRFTRERVTVLALQRALLPRRLPEQNAIVAAYRYQLAQGAAGFAWFDVIPLSGARVALVVGEVAGSGLRAAAAMGRLRTTISNFSALDLPPEEILAHLNGLVRQFAGEQAEQAEQAGDEDTQQLGDIVGDITLGRAGDVVTGTTCLYAVYDPTSQRCSLASAGHPPPAIVGPDGTVELPHLSAGPPLGRGGPFFEMTELSLPEGSRIVLYTGGLLADDPGDPRTGTQRLRQALEADPGRTAEDACAAALSALPHGRHRDDVIVLAACTRALPPGHLACWALPADPAAVSRVRAQAARQLSAWNLDELDFSTELIFSELVTNAIRYGAEPIRARLLLDRTLICEVSDASETAPRPRRAADTDEGGRGLFLVAQLAERWGTRYTRRGKVIWAEQPLDQETHEGTREPQAALGLPE